MTNSYSYSYSGAGISPVFGIIWLAFVIFFIYCGWKLFQKAGKPGWASFVPIYNLYVLIEVAGKPGWWLILYIIPVVNVIITIIVMYNLALRFGKGVGYTIGLVLLGFIFMPMLALGSAKYTPAPAPMAPKAA